MTTSEINFSNLTRSEILNLSANEKMRYFFCLQAKHRNLESIAEDMLHLLRPYNEISILALIGATGVGKTMLLRRMLRKLVKNSLSQNDPSTIPYIFISAPSDGSSYVKWSTIYENIIKEGHEILMNNKILVEERDGILEVRALREAKLKTLQQALVQMLDHRKVKVIVIDEAYHLLRFGNYSLVMDTLKTLASSAGTKLILAGSYQLCDLVTNYGQVSRRSEILHFQRYKKDNTMDKVEFNKLVKRLQDHWPCEEIPNFCAISNELMEVSLGLVGLLKSLLLASLSFQLKNKERWDAKFLIKSAKSVGVINDIRKEIECGEEKVIEAAYGKTIFCGKFLEETISKMSP